MTNKRIHFAPDLPHEKKEQESLPNNQEKKTSFLVAHRRKIVGALALLLCTVAAIGIYFYYTNSKNERFLEELETIQKYLELAKQAKNKGDSKEAEKNYRFVIEGDGENKGALVICKDYSSELVRLIAAEAYIGLSQWDKASEQIRLCKGDTPEMKYVKAIISARIHVGKKEYNEAIKGLDQILKTLKKEEVNKKKELRHHQAIAYEKKGDTAKALEAYQEAYDIVMMYNTEYTYEDRATLKNKIDQLKTQLS